MFISNLAHPRNFRRAREGVLRNTGGRRARGGEGSEDGTGFELERLMASPLAAFLHTRNQELREFLRRAASGSGGESDAPTPAQLDSLETRLREVGERLAIPTGAEPGIDTADYRESLERLQETLQAVQSALLARRARLEADRVQLQATRAWTAALKQTR